MFCNENLCLADFSQAAIKMVGKVNQKNSQKNYFQYKLGFVLSGALRDMGAILSTQSSRKAIKSIALDEKSLPRRRKNAKFQQF